MFCPKCGKINPDDKELCSGCGAQLTQAEIQVKDKKNGRILKTVVAVLVAIAVVCIVAAVLNGCGITNLPKEKMTF